jgi:alpha-N-arabinofuranosidase
MFAEYLGTEVPTSLVTGGGERFFYSVTRDPAKGKVYLKLVNASSVAQPVEINLTGADNIANSGTLITLSGSNDAETNTLSAPMRIVPVKSTLTNLAAKFTHTVPAHSVEVIELLTK